MAKIVLTISADNKATQSVKLLNAEVQTLSKTLSSITVNKDLTTQINALTRHYQAVAQAHAKVITNKNKEAIADEKLRQAQVKTATELVKQATAQARLEKAQQKTTATTEQMQKKFANLLSTLKSLKNAYPQSTFDSIEQSVRANLQAAKDGTKGVEELGDAYNTLSKDLAVAKAETEKVTTAVVKSGDSIGSLAKKFLLWQVTATLVMKPLRLISGALSSINETLVKTEDAVIALQRVLPSENVADSEISSRLYKIAQDYGQTFENVQQIATNFARTGMSWADTIKATEAAVLALNVAELNAEEATTGLIAILSQFGLEASDLENVIDKLNKTADNFPVTTQKILAALQRTGSAASNANLSLNETISLITALSKATGRSGENIGTALNSLIQYSSKSSALDVFAGLSDNTANVVADYRRGAKNILEVWEAVSKEIQSLDSRQADLLDSYFNTEDGKALSDALDGELENIYTEMAGVYDTANTFRKNYFIALLGNMDTVLQAQNTLADAEGYSQAENQKYLDTYTAKLNSLQAKWQDIANDEQGWLSFKKGLVDLGNGLLTLLDYMGGLKAAIIPVVTLFGVLFAGRIMSGLSKFTQGIKNLGANFKHPIQSIKNLKAATAEYNAALKAQSAAMKEQKIALEAQNKATELQTIADEKAAIATQLKTQNEQAAVVTTEMATAAEEAQTAAEEAQTLATKQQTLATELNTVAEKKAVTAGKALTAASKEMGAAASSAAGIWGILAFAIYEVIHAIDLAISASNENKDKSIENAKETVASFIEVTDSYNEQITAIKDLSQKIENINDILNDQNSSALQLEIANNQLLSIQSELIKSNEEYAESIDLVNGKLDEQAEIVRAKSEEEAMKIANDYLSRNAGAVAAAEKLLLGSNSKIDIASGTYRSKNTKDLKNILDEIIKESGVKNASASIWSEAGENWGIGLIPGLGSIINDIRESADGQKDFSIMDTLESGITDLFTKEGWTGQSTTRLNLSGSVQEQLETIEKIRKYLYENKDQYDEEYVRDIQAALEAQYQALNSSDYQNALKTIEANEMYSKYVEGSISLGQLQSWLAGDKEWATQWVNSLQHISQVEKENLINALEEARDLQKENLELAEKQLAVEEARIALLNAQNQATVRRFNESTGQWEWQVDEKKVAEAEKKLQEAQQNLSDYAADKAWNETKNAIQEGNATNKSILDILAKWAEVSMEEDPEFVKEIKDIIKSNGVDINEDEIKVSEDGTQTVYEDGKPKSYDSGGIANGLGFMPKATAQPETVNNPELTAKILSPVSNAQFDKYVRDMGIMFEMARQYNHAPVVERTIGNYDNRVDNSGQNIFNGVTVGKEYERTPFGDVLRMLPIIPKV